MLRRPLYRARNASLCLFVASFHLVVLAQPDPLAERTINHGEQMMAPSVWANGRMSDYTRDYDYPSATLYRRFPTLFFPPLPPVVGEKMAETAGVGFGSGFAANIDRETFYAVYTSLASVDELDAENIARVAAYRNTSQQLLAEIRAKFEEQANATPAARAAALSDLARQQDGRLRALTDEAENIRQALLKSNQDMDDFRLGGRGIVSDTAAQERLQLLFASSFTAGLSAEQRILLPEIASDRAMVRRKEGEEWTSGTPFFFFPATSRIQPPANLPAPLEAKIRAFVRERESLKRELRSGVLRDYLFRSSRTKRLAGLAQQQAPRFAALELLAEEIRVGLSALGFPNQMHFASWPADLTERVGSFYARKVEARRELRTQLRQLQNEYPNGTFEFKRQGDGLAIAGSGIDKKAEEKLAELNAAQARRYTTLARESEQLRQEIVRFTENSPAHLTRTVDQVAADFGKAYAARKSSEKFRDYLRAVMEPGLSPAQRRVVFQSATAELEVGFELLFNP